MHFIPRFFALAFSLAICSFCSSSHGQPEQCAPVVDVPAADGTKTEPPLFFETSAASWGRVRRVVEPVYPVDALAKGVGATVTIDVGIDALGGVKEIRSIESVPKDARFEQTVRDVLKHWLFHVSLTNRCVPYETVGSAQLVFAVVDGKPNIQLLHRPERNPLSTEHCAPKWLNRSEIYAAVAYPPKAQKGGAQANVHALLRVDSASGSVVDVEVTHVLTAKGFETAFSREAKSALERAKFEAMPGEGKIWHYCVPFIFRFSN